MRRFYCPHSKIPLCKNIDKHLPRANSSQISLFILSGITLSMGLLDFIMRRQNAYKLRKEYDRLREHTDKIHKIDQRLEILRMLDQIEPSIISLEEHHMSNYEKKKVYGYVIPQLRKVKFMINESKKSAKEKENAFKNFKDEEHDMH